jgi:hypothetical protein
MEKSTARSLSVIRLIPEQYQTNKLHDTNRIGQKKKKKKNPGGGEIFRTRPDRPWGPPNLLYNGYRVFLGG